MNTLGIVYCFDNHGKKKWSVRAGNIPGHFAMLELSPEE